MTCNIQMCPLVVVTAVELGTASLELVVRAVSLVTSVQENVYSITHT